MKSTDSILQNVNNGNYEVALILISQLQNDGPLSHDVQLCKVQCLYALHRYLEAHEAATKYTEEGNDMKELVFMHGVIAFALEQYDSAITYFATDPEWSIWRQKAYTMNQIWKGQSSRITFSDPLPAFDYKTVKKTWSQNEKNVTVSLNIPNLLTYQVNATFHLYAIDVEITEGKQVNALSIDLEKAIVPRTGVFLCHKDRIEFTAMKEKINETWEFNTEEVEKDPEVTLESILNDISTIPDVDDNTARNGFAFSMEKLGYDYSSEDEYEEVENTEAVKEN